MKWRKSRFFFVKLRSSFTQTKFANLDEGEKENFFVLRFRKYFKLVDLWFAKFLEA